MKFPDVKKSHVDSPDFRRELGELEHATDALHTHSQAVLSLLSEKAALARRDIQLTKLLVSELSCIGATHVVELQEGEEGEEGIVTQERISKRMESFSSMVAQLCENQEIFHEQVEVGLVQPLKEFVRSQLQPVLRLREECQGAGRRLSSLQERLAQCKRHEIVQMGETCFQLFDTKIYRHQLVCSYLSKLHSLHTNRLPESLTLLTQFLLTSSSYHNLSHSLLLTSQQSLSLLLQSAEKIRSGIELTQGRLQLDCERAVNEVAQSLALDLLNFEVRDLHLPYPTALANTKRHLSINKKSLPPISPEIFSNTSLLNPELATESLDSNLAAKRLEKCGYLNSGESKTFTTMWRRYFYWIETNSLMQQQSYRTTPKLILNLKLSTVKSVTTTEVDRNFCFKIISPTLTLLLQGESSRDVEEWVNALSFAIGQAFTTQRSMTVTNSSADNHTQLERCNSERISSSPLTPVTGISTETLYRIYSQPGNDKCADCSRSGPKWASINLGILLCIDCSGHHRGLGVHLSQIRSLILDSIKEEWLTKIEETGNSNFNSIFEAGLDSTEKSVIIKEEGGLKEFIIDKYQNLKYCRQDEKDRLLSQREEVRQNRLEKFCADKHYDLVSREELENVPGKSRKTEESTYPSASPELNLLQVSGGDKLKQKVEQIGRSVSDSIGHTISRIGSGGKKN